jgi:hypothetical protein
VTEGKLGEKIILDRDALKINPDPSVEQKPQEVLREKLFECCVGSTSRLCDG